MKLHSSTIQDEKGMMYFVNYTNNKVLKKTIAYISERSVGLVCFLGASWLRSTHTHARARARSHTHTHTHTHTLQPIGCFAQQVPPTSATQIPFSFVLLDSNAEKNATAVTVDGEKCDR